MEYRFQLLLAFILCFASFGAYAYAFDANGTQACFYDDVNFQGLENCYSIGEFASIDHAASNTFQSVRLPQDVEVFGFNNSSFGGSMEIYSQDTPTFLTQSQNIESLIVYDLSLRQFDPLVKDVCFYTQENYGGAEFCYGVGEHASIPSIQRNIFQSVRVPQDVEVFGFNNSSLGGSMEIYSQDTPTFSAQSQNIESLIAYDLSLRQFDPLVKDVCFYTQENYGGAEFCYGVGEHASIPSIQRNLFQSVRVPQDVEVFGFNNSSFGGSMEIYSQDTPTFSAQSQNIESLIAYDLSLRQFDPLVKNVCFYTQENFGGAEFCYGVGEHASIPSIQRNIFQSVRIPQDVEVFGFNNSSLGGSMEIYSQDTPTFLTQSQNIESLIAYDLSLRQFDPLVKDVCFYTQENYGGAEFCYGVGEHASIPSIQRNLFQSVRVPQDVEVFGFNNSSLGGSMEIYSQDTPTFLTQSQNIESLIAYDLSLRQFDPLVKDVCFYTQENYGGAEFCYGVGEHASIPSIQRNLFQSVRVPQDVEVFGFNNSSFGGSMEIYSQDTPTFSAQSQNIESMIAYDLSLRQFDPLVKNVCFYTQENFGGAEFCYGVGEHASIPSIQRNIFQSVRIPQDVEVFGFNNSSLGGSMEIYSQDTPTFLTQSQNIESLIAYDLSLRQFDPLVKNVCFYTKPSYGGVEVCYGVGDYYVIVDSFRNLPFRNLFQSVKIPLDVEVFGFGTTYFYGNIERYTTDSPTLPILDKDIEALKIYDRSVRQFDPLVKNVCFYPEQNFQGAEFCYGVGSHSTIPVMLRNLFRSVKVPQNVELFGFGTTYFYGNIQSYLSDAATLPVLDKDIEALKVFDLSIRQFDPSIPSACFYTQENYQGAEFCYGIGEYSTLSNIAISRFQSVQVPQNVEVIAYDTAYFYGATEVFTASAPMMASLSKKIDALKVNAVIVDTDGDSVPDETDQCPNTPAGSTVNSVGCSPDQLDTDGDSVPDIVDQCLNTTPGEAVNTEGCSAAQLDTDGDNIPDSIDQCPNTPAGEPADTTGCSATQIDTDGDLVPDVLDAFPNDPTESADLDLDGIGDNADPDRDGDGVSNELDLFPLDPTESADLDGDGIGDNADPDRDGDGVLNDSDAYPDDPARTALPIVTIDNPVTLTTLGHTPVTVSGTVDPTAVTFTVNGVPVTHANGLWQAHVTLEEGHNTVVARMVDPQGIASTASISLSMDLTPPYLTVESHTEGQAVYTNNIAISGLVNDIVRGTIEENQAVVTVNNIPATISNRSYLAQNILLTPGENIITINGTDAVGNSAQKTITINYQEPVGHHMAMVSGQNQSAGVSQQLPLPLVVQVLDDAGLAVANKNVVFRVSQGAGLIDEGTVFDSQSALVATDADGFARVNFQLGQRAGTGNHKVRARVVGYDDEVVFYATATVSIGNKLTVNAGNNQRGGVFQPLPSPFIVAVIDEGGNVVSGARVLFEVTSGGGLFQNGLASYEAVSDSDGRASAHMKLGGLTGLDQQIVDVTLLDGPVGQTITASFSASGFLPADPANTSVSGVVFDNQNNPLPGTTIRVDGTTRQAVADASGQFRILNVPVGPVHLIADGSTTTVEGEFPTLSYNIVTVSGVDNPLSAPIYMIKLDLDSAVNTGLENTEITLPEVPGFKLEIAKGSVTFPDGSKEGKISVTPVNASKVPMAPPNGMQPQFIVTIQPHGAIFDPPAPLSIPNVDALPPGSQVEMFSYDHDLEEFVAIGLGTVSNDGAVIKSNPGVGVVKAGWHLAPPPPPPPGCSKGGKDCGYCYNNVKTGKCSYKCEKTPNKISNVQTAFDCEQKTCGGASIPDDSDHPECKLCNGTPIKEGDSSGCDNNICNACSSGKCTPATVTIEQITEPMCEGETLTITGRHYPYVPSSVPGVDLSGFNLKWTTDTTSTISVFGNENEAIVKADALLGSANVVAYYKSRNQCAEDSTTFEVLPVKTDGRQGDFQAQYDFLNAKCSVGLHDDKQPHPIDGCSSPPELGSQIQDIKNLKVQATYGPFVLYQADSDHDYPVWGKDVGTIPDNDPRAKNQTLACNKHDICYQSCGSVRSFCDEALGFDARAECENHYPPTCPSSNPLVCTEYLRESTNCQKAVTFMYNGIVGLLGNSAYVMRQSQHCICCKP